MLRLLSTHTSRVAQPRATRDLFACARLARRGFAAPRRPAPYERRRNACAGHAWRPDCRRIPAPRSPRRCRCRAVAPERGAVTVAGYIGDVAAWARFEGRWEDYLTRIGVTLPFRMSAFSSKAAETLPPGTRTPARKCGSCVTWPTSSTAASECRQHRHRHTRRLACCRQAISAQGVPLHSLRDRADAVTAKAIKWIGRPNERHQINRFVFESGDNGQADFAWLMARIVEAGAGRLEAVRPIFEPKSLKPLQAADFVAWETRQAVITKPQ